MFKPNDRYLIKSPTGYSRFDGVLKKTTDTLYTILFEDGSHIKCSGGHAFLTSEGFTKAENLEIGFDVSGKVVWDIVSERGQFDVYDPVGVEEHNTYYAHGVISHNTEFLGSSSTLISGAKIAQLMALVEQPKIKDMGDKFYIYEEPIPGHTYTICVDVSEGLGQDYSTFSVIDVTKLPYKLVAKYRNNTIAPMLFPTVIYTAGKKYNYAFVLVEINSIGLQVSDILHFELDYENLIKIQIKGKQGQQHTPGFTKKIAYGIKTSKQTKNIGCANLKTLVESDKLLIPDEQTINELTTFSVDKQTFKAEQGSNDDLIMPLVNFGWLTAQRVFKETINNDIRQALQTEQMALMDQDIVPFGIIDNGLDDPFEVDDRGDRWFSDRSSLYPFDDFNWNPFSRM